MTVKQVVILTCVAGCIKSCAEVAGCRVEHYENTKCQIVENKKGKGPYKMYMVEILANPQGFHRSGKFLKSFFSQGNQGNTGDFQPKSGKKISNQ